MCLHFGAFAHQRFEALMVLFLTPLPYSFEHFHSAPFVQKSILARETFWLSPASLMGSRRKNCSPSWPRNHDIRSDEPSVPHSSTTGCSLGVFKVRQCEGLSLEQCDLRKSSPAVSASLSTSRRMSGTLYFVPATYPRADFVLANEPRTNINMNRDSKSFRKIKPKRNVARLFTIHNRLRQHLKD